MKRFLALALALVMALSLAACGNSGSSNPPSDSTDPGTQQATPNTSEPSNAPDKTEVSTDWFTKPFHIKGTAYDGTEPDEEMEILYDGEALLTWKGANGVYLYFEGDTLMDKRLEREEGVISLQSNDEAVARTILQFMENEAIFLNTMSYHLNEMENYKDMGSETVEGFDCVKYESKEEDMLGDTYTFWIDKATGIFVKEQTASTLGSDMKKMETPEIEISYVANYISVKDVPSIASLYAIPNE